MTDYEIETLAYRAVESGNFLEAQRLLEPLASRNSEYALMTLGWIHEAGGTPSDRELALSFYERASQIGCEPALIFVGRLLREDGNFAEARRVYQIGALKGNLGCMCWLGDMMLAGEGGPLDAESGELWINVAARKGHFIAKRKLLHINLLKSRSTFKYVSYYIKLSFLICASTKFFHSDPYSDKVL